MAGSTFGNIFKITTWGESHGKGLGVVIDGCPAGIALLEADIQKFLDRRKPGQSNITTQRKEAQPLRLCFFLSLTRVAAGLEPHGLRPYEPILWRKKS